MKTVLILLIVCLYQIGCSNLQLNEGNSFELEGKWVVSNVEKINDPALITPTDGIDLIKLFGVEAWSNAKGKYFEFDNNKDLRTNVLTPEMGELVELKYQFDTVLIIIADMKNDHSYYESNVNFQSIGTDKMAWEIGGLLKVTLNRTK